MWPAQEAQHADDHDDHEAEEEEIRIDQQQDRLDFKAEWTDLGGLVENVLLRAAYNDYRHQELEGSEVGTQFDQDAYDLRVHLGHAPVAGWGGTLGVQYTGSDLEARGDEAYVPPSQTDAYSLFLVERRRFDRLTVDLGTRLERQEIETDAAARDYSGTALTLAGGLLWSFSESLTGALQLTRSERRPQAAELYADGPHLAVGRYEIGDDRLGTETANTVDFGLRRTGAVTWRASIFYSDFTDYIFPLDTGAEEDGHVTCLRGRCDLERRFTRFDDAP